MPGCDSNSARCFAEPPTIDLPDGHAAGIAVKANAQKYFTFPKILISRMLLGIPPRHEGRIAVVTKRAAECGGREDAGDVRHSLRTMKSCGPGAPM
jgi:hypothetical protein